MKTGFIVEGKDGGRQSPDMIVYPMLAEKFCSKLERGPVRQLGTKKDIIDLGGAVAKQMIDSDGCDYVIIIWDRMPKWGGSGRCEEHHAAIQKSLVSEDVPVDRIILCCIADEMESWIIGDGAAVTAFFQQFSRAHRLQPFPSYTTEHEQSKAFQKLRRYNGRYNKATDNVKIVALIDDWNRIARYNDSFRHFKESIERICSGDIAP